MFFSFKTQNPVWLLAKGELRTQGAGGDSEEENGPEEGREEAVASFRRTKHVYMETFLLSEHGAEQRREHVGGGRQGLRVSFMWCAERRLFLQSPGLAGGGGAAGLPAARGLCSRF